MKQWIGFASLLFALTACQGASDNRTETKVDPESQQQAPSSDPNVPVQQPLDTSTGAAPDSSTVVSYDTSAKARHN
ncbi:hypothetical protein [Flaviaesturariibacter amylovorans]|uniref:Uncharacterized protein n=1 Tax=Flaviaesturariibacter amylovorans TaxID=1084520 RepID=A0ABP8GBT1_9BACT